MNIDNRATTTLTLDRARAIVSHAQNEFGSDRRIDDAFEPFARGGATTRLEALHAHYIAAADFFRLVATRKPGSTPTMKQFDQYANLSMQIAMRIVCDDIRDEAVLMDTAMRTGGEFESFVAYVKTLDPTSAGFWPQVYQHMGIDYPLESVVRLVDNSTTPKKTPWWRFW